MEEKKCCVVGCDRPYKLIKHKLCAAHYLRFQRKGDPGNAIIRPKKEFKVYKGKKK